MTAGEQLAKVRDLAGRIPPATHLRAMRKWLREFRAVMRFDTGEFAEMLRGMYTPEAIAKAVERHNPMFANILRDQNALEVK